VSVKNLGDEDVQQAIAVDIVHVRSHACQRLPVDSHRHAGPQADLFEDTVPFVVKQEIRRRIVGDVDVFPTVGIVIAEDDAQPFAFRAVDPRCARDIGKRAVAVVAKENVRRAVVPARDRFR
jgi:hypothetical protein